MEASAESSGACCRKRLSRKWGPFPPPASRLVDDDFDDSKVRMTPEAQHWHPFLRRTKGFLIDYSKQSNSTHYTYLFPDPVPYPSTAPTPAIALAPLFGDDYGTVGDIIQWTVPDYTFFPPVTDWVEPPIA
ncbi:hypothetical protein M758_10G095800 [Ceratodon purpureus]|nr:hypothetical protein M758_10G095800 [Ceratodon purpureus]